ncbi:MAG: DUF4124 domain-containing protein [Sedimenticolaceae bacterium]
MADPRNPWIQFALAMAWLLSVPSVPAAEVFRWTDESGQVHYGERPPLEGADRIELPQSGSPAPGVDAGIAQRRERQGRLLDAYEYERAQKKARQALEEEQRQKAATRCARIQQYWRRLSYAGPVYQTRADGTREYLSDPQRESEKARVLPSYVQACGKGP